MAWDSASLALSRNLEPDRYLAALVAPAAARDDLLALAAFAAEIRRIPRLVRDPLVGEIRLTWWRETIEALADGEITGHPVADRLAGPIRSGSFPLPRLTSFIDAMAFDLSPAPFADAQAREVYLSKTEGTLFGLSLVRLGGAEEALRPLVRAAAVVYGLARACVARDSGLPLATAEDLVATGTSFDQLMAGEVRAERAALSRRLAEAARAAATEVRYGLRDLPVELRPAFLPLAMTAQYLRWSTRPTGAPPAAPLVRVWRIWRAARTGRLGD